MNKQSVKEFFKPQLSFFILGSISLIIIFIIFISSGVDGLNEFIGNLLTLSFIFNRVFPLSVPRSVVGLFPVIWLLFFWYFFSCLFANIYQKKLGKKKDEKSKNLKGRLLKNILWLILLGVGFIFLSTTPCCGGKARNSRIIGAIAQARTTMSYIFGNDGNYNNFNCDFEDMPLICQEIDQNFGEKDQAEPIITLNNTSNSNTACIYSPLNPPENRGWVDWIKRRFSGTLKEWYCADSQGYAGRTTTDPGSAGYCVDGVSAKCPPVSE